MRRMTKVGALAVALALGGVGVSVSSPAKAGVVDATTGPAQAPGLCVQVINTYGAVTGSTLCALIVAGRTGGAVWHLVDDATWAAGQPAIAVATCQWVLQNWAPAQAIPWCAVALAGRAGTAAFSLVE